MKWFKRFRKASPKSNGRMNKKEFLQVFKRLYHGNGDVFTNEIFNLYEMDSNYYHYFNLKFPHIPQGTLQVLYLCLLRYVPLLIRGLLEIFGVYNVWIYIRAKLTLTYHHLRVTLFGAKIIPWCVFPLDYISLYYKTKYNDNVEIVMLETQQILYIYPSLETCILYGNEISSIWNLYIYMCVCRMRAYKTIIH